MPSATLFARQRLVWLAYLGALVLATCIYFADAPALGEDIDDDNALHDNLAVAEDFSVLLAGGHHHPSGRPVGHLVRWLVFALWGNELAGYHLLSVAVHTLVAFFLARLACALGMRMEAGMLGGLLFLVNVGHFKAVHQISYFVLSG